MPLVRPLVRPHRRSRPRFRRLIAELFAAPRTPIRNARRTRLHAEALEAREVPATLTWTGEGLDNEFNNPYNWLPAQVPTIGDDVVFLGAGGDEGDTEEQIKALPANKDCDNLGLIYGTVPGPGGGPPTAGTGFLNSLRVLEEYRGTVTLSAEQQFAVLELASEHDGSISQPYGHVSPDITVTSEFFLTGGTLNSSTHTATVILDGATGTIAPHDEGAVGLGSNLSVINAALLTMYAGTVTVINSNVLLTVADRGGIIADPGANSGTPSITIEALPQANLGLKVDETGFVELRRGVYNHYGYLNNLGGRVTTKSNTTLVVHGTANTIYPYYQSSGQTQLYANSKLKVPPTKAVDIGGGKLSTIAVGNNSDATIEANVVKVSGGEVVIGDGSTPHVYGTLNVLGNVLWVGGTYRPVVLGTVDGGSADKWKCSVDFVVGGTAVIAPGSINALGVEVPPSQPGMKWLIMEAESEILVRQGDNPPNVSGGFFELEQVPGDPIKKWKVKSKGN